MRRDRALPVMLATVLLYGLCLAGCTTSTVEPTTTGTDDPTGIASGKTLLIATQNTIGHSEQTTVTEVQTEVGVVSRTSDEPFVVEQVASDPRATGTVDIVAQTDVRADNSGEISGSWILTNEGGTWKGTVSSTMSAKTAVVPNTQYLRVIATGTGDYEGLVLRLQGYGPALGDENAPPGADQVFTGWIQEAE